MFEKVIDSICKSKEIGITFHQNPDGDSLGSGLALLQGLLQLGKNAYIISLEECPDDFKFLPMAETIDGKTTEPSKDTDLVIVLDCGNVERINASLNLQSEKYSIINIDHHMSNDNYGSINYVNTKSAAVGEIIFSILEYLEVDINKEIATTIYTSLLTDTGSFRHSNTTENTHNVAGKLIATGCEFSKIHQTLFENTTLDKLKLQGEVINNMELAANNKICFMKVTLDDLNKFNLLNGDTSDLITLGTKIKTVEVAVLIKEAEDKIKVSLRAKSYVDVRKIAEIYGGGGHTKASGFATQLRIEDIKKELLTIIEKELVI
ncbi:phosphoesterase RecJ domain-containing protein [Clostridium grantii DSM 8605]|uniref:Phosphoesterase RecJ domain-containing protein n=2 Tax=Clostridium TaxID=1485 RepID=A0A1M5QXR0_9CLOT|nr:phosphoesterase RecJ domain-containing protein [Clostridium grantii DSM 8605]